MASHKLTLSFALTTAFFAGCVAHQLVVIPPARAGTDVQRWEYLLIESSGVEEWKQQSAKAGREGWELVYGQNYATVYKRRLP
jgi:hypothetical protein